MLFTSFLLHLLVAALFFALPTAVCRNGNTACGGLNLRIGDFGADEASCSTDARSER